MFGIPRLLSNSGVVDHPNDADVDDDGNIATPGSGLHPDGGIDISDILAYNALFKSGDVRGDLDNGSGLGLPDGGVGIDDQATLSTSWTNPAPVDGTGVRCRKTTTCRKRRDWPIRRGESWRGTALA